MKMKLISAGVILLLILTGFGNSVYVTARCEGWERQLTAAETAAVEEDWETATIQLDALHRSWDKAEDYLHIVLHHEEVEDALDQFADTLVLQIAGYQETDFGAIIQDYAQRNPDRVMEVPGVSVRTFPDQGETRVVELSFHYRTDRSELRAMREQVQPVFSSAALYVSGGAGEWTKFNQLHTFLTERFDAYTIESTITPAYSLLCQGVGDSRAFAQVYAAMCSRIGLEARVVSGKRDGELRWWNLVRIDGSWYHLDLMTDKRFAPRTDELMTGYEWDRTVYPAAPAPGE